MQRTRWGTGGSVVQECANNVREMSVKAAAKSLLLLELVVVSYYTHIHEGERLVVVSDYIKHVHEGERLGQRLLCMQLRSLRCSVLRLYMCSSKCA